MTDRPSMADDLRAAHPGEWHEWRTTCLRCGEPGMLNVSIVGPDERVNIARISDDASLALALRDWMEATGDDRQTEDDLRDAAGPWLETHPFPGRLP